MSGGRFYVNIEDEVDSRNLILEEHTMTDAEKEAYGSERVLQVTTVDVPWITEAQVLELRDKLTDWLVS